MDRNPGSIVVLIGLFVISFTAPIFFALKLGGYLMQSESGASEEKELFKNPVHIAGSGNYLKIQNSSPLAPVAGEDFLLTFWFRLQRMPAQDEKMVVLTTYDADQPNRPGYMLSLNRDGDKVRPVLYWQDKKGAGNWYTFTEVPLPTRNWVMAALSFRNDSLLGLHMALPGEKEGFDLKLMGGYDLGTEIVPAGQADLILGALNVSRFRGLLGPIAVYSKKNLGKKLKEVLEETIRDPLSIPSSLSNEDVRFWSPDGVKDLSAAGRSIEIVTPRGQRREASSLHSESSRQG
jgi:hypothetical protein